MTKETTTKPDSFVKKTLTTLAASAIVSVIVLSNIISYGATIFSGDLTEYLSRGIGGLLAGGLVITAFITLTSSTKGVIATPKAATIPILAQMALGIAVDMPKGASPEEVFSTIAVTLGVSTFLIGLVFLLFGLFKIGNLIRFIPYPIFGGFMAGVGWLLLRGGLGVTSTLPLTVTALPRWVESPHLARWLPAALFAILLLILQRRYQSGAVMPLTFLGGLALFHLIGWATGTTQAEMAQAGWLLGPFPDTKPQIPILLTILQNASNLQSVIQTINWDVIYNQASTALTLIPISLLSLIFANSGFELTTKQDANLNQELRVTGLANMMGSLGGGIIGCQNASIAALPYKMGRSNRFTGLFTAAFLGLGFFYGPIILSILPKALIGGLLIYLGLSFLVRWLLESYAAIPKTEYAILFLIHGVIVTRGLIEGVLVGLVAAAILFVIKYSQVDVIRKTLSRATYQSNVDRFPHSQEYLQEQGQKIYILKLQGFIFFGTAYRLFEHVKDRVMNATLPPLTALVLDFKLVNGIDSSALDSFRRMVHTAEVHNFSMVYSDLSEEVERQFIKGDLLDTEEKITRRFKDIDHAVEWCENQVLSSSEITSTRLPSIKAYLSENLPETIKIERLLKYLEEQLIEEGTPFIRKGDPPYGIYFIELGQVTVQMKLDSGEVVRLRTTGSGTTIGELGVYLEKPASATVVADMPTVAYFLSREALAEIEENDSDLATALHKFMVGLIGKRLLATNIMVRALMD